MDWTNRGSLLGDALLIYISLLGTRVQTPSDRAACFIPFSSMNYRQRPVLLNLSRLLPRFQPRLNLKRSPGDHHHAECFTTSVIWFVFPSTMIVNQYDLADAAQQFLQTQIALYTI